MSFNPHKREEHKIGTGGFNAWMDYKIVHDQSGTIVTYNDVCIVILLHRQFEIGIISRFFL